MTFEYPCVKCGNNCCRLEECKKFPCELIKENCSLLWDFIKYRKEKEATLCSFALI
jgi:hypothetical protein